MALCIKIIYWLLFISFISSCNNHVASEKVLITPETEIQNNRLDNEVAGEIKAGFRSEYCTITRETSKTPTGDKEIVIIKNHFTDLSLLEESASLIAFAFYRLSQINKLKPCDLIRIKTTSDHRLEFNFKFNDFAERDKTFKNTDSISALLVIKNYAALKKYLDFPEGSTEARRIISLFKQENSISGKIDNFNIVSIAFWGNLTKIKIRANHTNKTPVYYSFGFSRKTDKVQYVDIDELDLQK